LSLEKGTLFAKTVSYLFHPLLLPTLGLFLIFNINEAGLWIPTMEMQSFLYSITLLATLFLPLTTVLVLVRLNIVNSLEMTSKEERKIPYLASAAFYFSESYFLLKVDVPVLVQAMMLGATLLILITLIINLYWLVSAHMVGIGGLCGMMVAISARLQINIHPVLIVLFIIAGLVAFSRLRLGAHSPAQVYAGFLLGATVQSIFLLTL